MRHQFSRIQAAATTQVAEAAQAILLSRGLEKASHSNNRSSSPSRNHQEVEVRDSNSSPSLRSRAADPQGQGSRVGRTRRESIPQLMSRSRAYQMRWQTTPSS